MRALEFPIVDYFSLDIEGAEYQVLKTIPFQYLNIKLFGIETEHAGKVFKGSEKDIKDILKANGYEYVAKTKLDKFVKRQGKRKAIKTRKILSIK